MPDINEKRSSFLKMLEPARRCLDLYYRQDSGAGLAKKARRLFRHKTKYIRYAIARLKIYPSQLIFVKTFWGKKIFLSLLDASDASILYCGLCSAEEYKLVKFLIKNFQESDIFYDIGTHVGFYSLLAREFISQGEVHCFEPAERTFFCLKKTFAGEKNVFLNQLALTDQPGRINFFDKSIGPGDGSGSSTIMEEVINQDNPRSYKIVEAEAATLDKYLKNHSQPAILKIDVEGAEDRVLKGGANFFSQNSPIVIIEVWPGKNGRNFSLRAINRLYQFGYKSYKISPEGELIPWERIDLEKDIARKWDNFVFRKS